MSSEEPIPPRGTTDGHSKPVFSKFVYDAIKQANSRPFQEVDGDHEDHSDREIHTASPEDTPSERSLHTSRDDTREATLNNPNSPPSSSSSEAMSSSPSLTAPHNHQPRDPTTAAAISDLVASKLAAERDLLASSVLAQLQPAAAAAAEREVDRLVAEMGRQRETAEQKARAVLDRVQDLSGGELERLFARGAMVRTLRRLLERLELEEACGEWEDLGRGRGKGR